MSQDQRECFHTIICNCQSLFFMDSDILVNEYLEIGLIFTQLTMHCFGKCKHEHFNCRASSKNLRVNLYFSSHSRVKSKYFCTHQQKQL